MSKLLRQFYTQPADDAECKAKFALYEDFLATVEESRKVTLEFWAECKVDFSSAEEGEAAAGGAVDAMERVIKSIDGADNMGIVWRDDRWFVYDMTQKACVCPSAGERGHRQRERQRRRRHTQHVEPAGDCGAQRNRCCNRRTPTTKCWAPCSRV